MVWIMYRSAAFKRTKFPSDPALNFYGLIILIGSYLPWFEFMTEYMPILLFDNTGKIILLDHVPLSNAIEIFWYPTDFLNFGKQKHISYRHDHIVTSDDLWPFFFFYVNSPLLFTHESLIFKTISYRFSFSQSVCPRGTKKNS